MRVKRRKPVIPPSSKYVVDVDTETTGLHLWLDDRVYAVSMCWGPADNLQYRYYEWPVDKWTRKVTPDPADVEAIRTILEDERITKRLHNAKFDITGLRIIGIEIKGRVEDTSFMARICNSLEQMFGLKYLAWKKAGYPQEDQIDLKAIVKKLRLKAKKLGWKISTEGVEPDYWLVQYIDELMPELSKKEREEIKNMVGVYALGDVIRTKLLGEQYEEELEDRNYRETYERELVLLRGAVMHMEARGMALSATRANSELAKALTNRDRHYDEVMKMAAERGFHDFKPGSSKQLCEILYGTRFPGSKKRGYGLEAMKSTDSGGDSTDWMALRPYKDHPFIRELMAYRSSDKSISTFFQKYVDMMRPDIITVSREAEKYGYDPGMEYECDTQVLHPSLNQGGTITGRFSCNDPNLQQVANADTAARGTDPIQARAPFGPRPGYVWYLADFAQMELRVFADEANIGSMLKAIREGRDLNTENSNKVYGGKKPAALEACSYALELGHDKPTKPEVQVAWDTLEWNSTKAKRGPTSTLALQAADDYMKRFNYDIVLAEKSVGKNGSRGRTKIMTFCKIYGGGWKAVIDLLYCTEEEAQRYWKDFDDAFPEMEPYFQRAIRLAREKGFIVTRYGRKLQIEPRFAYRAVNYMIQGTCADVMKEGIRKCHEFLQDIGIDGHCLMTIHDELIFEIREGHNYKWVLRELVRLMSDHEGRLRVTMPVEMKRARLSWDQKEPVLL